ncbi:MAG: protein kinase domain-containing protein [Nocardioides sp.]|uniref:protein kinase domain-containing protein n=1 Tax=Nocardioides sp. TaxID=35761 RepID=UPI003D6BB453
MSRDIPTSPQPGPAQPGALTPNDPREMGPYALSGRLGHGGMGVVYLGEDDEGTRAAVKAILPELTSDPGFRARFEREIEAAKKVRSRFTADVLAADAEAEHPWMASEYIADPPLSQLVGSGRRLTEIDVRQLVAGVAEALAAVHDVGLVHRDIKPGNILYGDTDPCLIDLGIARAVDGTALTQAGKAVGTYGYQAPEQVQTGTFSSAVDIWALGLVAFVAATGRWPFTGEIGSMGHLLKGESANLSFCPDYLRPLVAACLAEAPSARPSAADILATNGDWSLLPAPATEEEETTIRTLPGTGTADLPVPPVAMPVPAPDTGSVAASQPAQTPQPARLGRRGKLIAVVAAAVVLLSAGVAVASNPGLVPGLDDTPSGEEASPSAKPTAGESSGAAKPSTDASATAIPEPGVTEEPAEESETTEEIVPGSVTVSGDAAPGGSLVASAVGWDPMPTDSYCVWSRGGTEVLDGPCGYKIRDEDAGYSISVTMTGSAEGFSSATASASTDAVSEPVETPTDETPTAEPTESETVEPTEEPTVPSETPSASE